MKKSQKKGAKRRFRKFILLILLVLVVGFVVTRFVLPQPAKSAQTASQIAKSEVLLFAKASTLEERVEVAGNIEAQDSRVYSFGAEREVLELKVAMGDRVEKGQLLATTDLSDAQLLVKEIEAQLAAARAEGRRSSIETLEIKLAQAQKQLEKLSIVAPFDAVVTACDMQAGLAGGKLEISSTAPFVATVSVGELDANKVKIDSSVVANFRVAPDEEYKARVTKKSPRALTDARGSMRIAVELEFEQLPAHILEGFSFSGSIVSGEATPVVVVPNDAIGELPSGELYVMRKRGDETQATQVVVEVAYHNSTESRIMKGDIAEGDKLLQAPPFKAQSEWNVGVEGE